MLTMHRAINVAGAVAIVATMVSIQQVDAISERTTAMAVANDKAAARMEAAAAQRLWREQVAVCSRAFGPQTQPAEDADGRLVCVDARGRRADPVQGAVVKVASK